MSTLIRVLGVLGLCCVDFCRSTHVHAAISMPYTGSVVGVLGLLSRTRRRDVFSGAFGGASKAHANTQKLNKPNTLNTASSNSLISLVFKCVGIVLGCVNLCWVHLGRDRDDN